MWHQQTINKNLKIFLHQLVHNKLPNDTKLKLSFIFRFYKLQKTKLACQKIESPFQGNNIEAKDISLTSHKRHWLNYFSLCDLKIRDLFTLKLLGAGIVQQHVFEVILLLSRLQKKKHGMSIKILRETVLHWFMFVFSQFKCVVFLDSQNYEGA